MIASYPCPLAGGGSAEEFALAFDRGRPWRLLIVPALFEEASRMRRFTVEVMRRLDGAGIDCFLPDLPGCNESLQVLENQAPDDWYDAMAAAARHFGATHVLGIRGGALVMPAALPGWRYAPARGAAILRQMIRARIFSAREAGVAETHDDLLQTGREDGMELAGYRLSADFLRQLETLVPRELPGVADIDQGMVGCGGLWLRAEPAEDRHQADALAAVLAIAIKA